MFAIQLPVGKMIAVALLQASLLLSSLLPCPFPHPCHFRLLRHYVLQGFCPHSSGTYFS